MLVAKPPHLRLLVVWLIGWSVCWLVCHNFLKGREFALPCSSRSTCLPEIRCKPYCLNFICQVVINFLSKPKRKGSHQSFITKHQTRKVFVLQAKEGISILPINSVICAPVTLLISVLCYHVSYFYRYKHFTIDITDNHCYRCTYNLN